MTPEQWEKVSEIFQSAAELSADERSAFLKVHCGGDETVRREVESLLAAETEVGDFIERPIVGEFVLDGNDHERAFSAGDTIGHYTIDAAIGFGGMGEVYRATDLKL